MEFMVFIAGMVVGFFASWVGIYMADRKLARLAKKS